MLQGFHFIVSLPFLCLCDSPLQLAYPVPCLSEFLARPCLRFGWGCTLRLLRGSVHLPRHLLSFPHLSQVLWRVSQRITMRKSARFRVGIMFQPLSAALHHGIRFLRSPRRLGRTCDWLTRVWIHASHGRRTDLPSSAKATDVRLRTHPSTGSALARVAVSNRPPARLLALLAWLVSIREPILCHVGAEVHLCCPYRSAWQRRRRDARRVATLSAELHTQGSPLTHVCLGYCWRNSKFWHLHWGQNNCFCDFWSHVRMQRYTSKCYKRIVGWCKQIRSGGQRVWW